MPSRREEASAVKIIIKTLTAQLRVPPLWGGKEGLNMKYIVLLRGINVSGKNKLPMAELRELLNGLGFQNVQTYIQSGNIVLSSEMPVEELSEVIKKGIKDRFDYDVPVITRTVDEWKTAIDAYPFSTENPKIVGFAFLDSIPKETDIEIKGQNEDKFKVVKEVVYLYCPSGFGKTKFTNKTLETKLKVTATTRNLKTTLKLLDIVTNS